ncbi:MAG: hypothetical protein GY870_07520 [archaeon]|nr:hypothetical protein [archaeon]
MVKIESSNGQAKGDLKLNIREISTEEIEEELKRRQNKRPIMLPDDEINNNQLKKTCEFVIKDYDQRGYSKDAAQYVYESAMECFYGKDVFDWINDNDEGC